MKISKKNTINIKKFLNIHLGKEYNEKRKLTHNYLFEYLENKGSKLPRRVSFKQISQIDILTGKVIFVVDELGKIIPYLNPLMFNELSLKEELNSKQNVELAKKARRNYLHSKGYTEGKNGEIIKISDTFEEEYTIEHSNRHKVLANKRR